MKRITRGRTAAALFLSAALIFLFAPGTEAAVRTEECLECHEAYKGVNHAGLDCVDCHTAITALPHEEKLPLPACRTCHERTVASYDRGIHKKKGLGCRDCHNVHFPEKDKRRCASCHADAPHRGLPAKSRHLDRLACVACHAKADGAAMQVRLSIEGRKGISPGTIDKNGDDFIDRSEWRALEDLLRRGFGGRYAIERVYSVSADPHAVAARPSACDACHSADGYFASAKLVVAGPQANGAGIDPRIFIPELPSGKDFEKTAHGRAGVTCADCHTSRGTASECAGCHGDVDRAYRASLHSKKGATRCTDCHDPHRVMPYRTLEAKERVAVCARCHTDYLKKHAWLPHTSLHFGYLECASCHSPRSQKGIVFFFARKSPAGKVRLTYEQLARLYGRDPSGFVKEGSPDAQIGRLFTALLRRDNDLVIDASIVVTKPFHDYWERPVEERHCVACHSRQAAFYNSMLFILPAKGPAEYIPVKGTLLAAYPIARSVDFFLVNEDKLTKDDILDFLLLRPLRGGMDIGFKWIYFAGFWLIVLICAAICCHVILRLTVRR